MFKLALASTFIARLRRAVIRQRQGAHIGTVTPCRAPSSPNKDQRPTFLASRNVAALITFLITIILSFVPLVGLTTTAAHACACGCSVFDVGGSIFRKSRIMAAVFSSNIGAAIRRRTTSAAPEPREI